MGLSNKHLIDGATARWSFEFNRGIVDHGHGEWDKLVIVLPAGDLARSTVTDARPAPENGFRRVYHKAWNERVAGMQRVHGEIPARGSRLRKASFVTYEYGDRISENLRELRQPEYMSMVADSLFVMGQGVGVTKGREFWTTLGNADGLEGYDGVPLFATNHPGLRNGEVIYQTNLFDGMPLTKANLIAVLGVMTSYFLTDGRIAGNRWTGGQTERTFTLFYAPDLEETVSNLLAEDPVAQNPLAGTFTPSKVHGLPPGHWIVCFDFDEQSAPFVLCDGGARVDSETGYDTYMGRTQGMADWVARAEFGFGVYRWHKIALCRI